MPRFELTEDTQLIRVMDAHEAAMKMANGLGIVGEIRTVVGDFAKNGWTTGWAGEPSPGPHGRDVLVEVYIAPLIPDVTTTMMDDVLALQAENAELRRKLAEANALPT